LYNSNPMQVLWLVFLQDEALAPSNRCFIQDVGRIYLLFTVTYKVAGLRSFLFSEQISYLGLILARLLKEWTQAMLVNQPNSPNFTQQLVRSTTHCNDFHLARFLTQAIKNLLMPNTAFISHKTSDFVLNFFYRIIRNDSHDLAHKNSGAVNASESYVTNSKRR
jgi:hypothetical protein